MSYFKEGEGMELAIFSGNPGMELAKKICDLLGTKLFDSEVGRFSDGEISVNIKETVRGKDVFIIQPTCPPVNDNLMELLIMMDAFKRASAGRINAVLPYYGYARQDRKAKSRDPITAKLVADLIATAGAHRVIALDLHTNQIQGYFNIPTDHLYGTPIFVKYFEEKGFNRDGNSVVVAPDLGSVTRSRKFAEKLGLPIAFIDKRRPRPNVSEIMNVIGDINNKKCIILDDIIDTAGTITNSAKSLMDMGAKEVYVAASHGVLSGNAMERLTNAPIKEVILLDSIPFNKDLKEADKNKFIILSTATLFAKAIERIHKNKSVSPLFD